MKITKLDWLKLVSKIIKGIYALAMGSAIMVDANTYTSLIVFSMGVIADSLISFIKEKEHDQIIQALKKDSKTAT